MTCPNYIALKASGVHSGHIRPAIINMPPDALADLIATAKRDGKTAARVLADAWAGGCPPAEHCTYSVTAAGLQVWQRGACVLTIPATGRLIRDLASAMEAAQ